MNRRNFIENLTLGSGVLATASLIYAPATGQPVKKEVVEPEMYTDVTESLMPELEELVKKNPNRLIGCGG